MSTVYVSHAESTARRLRRLAQLYQLRGRVGRSDRPAYAYLLVPPEMSLSPVAKKRLAAIREFSDLGSGFRVAALDLEIRGAGNLLGGEQSGHIEAIGFEMYMKLLEETVRELKGEEIEDDAGADDLGVSLRTTGSPTTTRDAPPPSAAATGTPSSSPRPAPCCRRRAWAARRRRRGTPRAPSPGWPGGPPSRTPRPRRPDARASPRPPAPAYCCWGRSC